MKNLANNGSRLHVTGDIAPVCRHKVRGRLPAPHQTAVATKAARRLA
jgi:hypothetical protein